MTYVISSACGRDAQVVCRSARWIASIEGNRSPYINPDECVDCGVQTGVQAGGDLLRNPICLTMNSGTSPITPRSSAKSCRVEIAPWFASGAAELGPANNRPGIGAVGSDLRWCFGPHNLPTPRRPLHVDNSTR